MLGQAEAAGPGAECGSGKASGGGWALKGGISLLALALAAALPEAAAAQQGQAASGADLDLDTITVTASSTQYTVRDAPASVSVIGEQEIQRRPVNDVDEILREVPGVNMGFGSDGKRGISIRGLGSGYTLILVDGKRVNAGLTNLRHGNGDSNWVPVEAIERIEVVRGPMSTLYGSDAFGGVVNIITKRPGSRWGGSVSVETMVPGNAKAGRSDKSAFTLSGPLIPDTLSLRIYGNYARRGDDEPGLNLLNTGRYGLRNYDGSAMLSWTPNSDHTVDLEVTASEQKATGEVDELEGGVSRGPSRMTRETVSLSHKGNWGFGTSTLTASAEFATNHSRTVTAGLPVDNSIDANLYTLEGRFSRPFDLFFRHNLTVGGTVQHETLDDPQNLGKTNSVTKSTGTTDTSLTNYALYVENNTTLTDKLIFTQGLRGDFHEKFGEHASPRLYLVYNPTDSLTFKGGWSTGFKAPNLRQLNPNWVTTSRGRGCGAVGGPCEMVGNPDLKPETLDAFEVGAYFDGALFGIHGWKASATYFYNDIQNKITSARVASLILPNGTKYVQQVNVDRARTQGIEGNLTVPLHERLTWTTNFTYLIEAVNLETKEPLSASPELSVYSELSWKATEKLWLNLSANYLGKQVDYVATSETLTAQVVKPYTIFNLGATYQIRDDLRLKAGVLNLFDRQVSTGSNYTEEVRRYYVGLNGTF
ncbi:TonB-dependent receptor domain-containing protein [Bosea minatitlanensis]|uniref:TonB-dependent receptor domain-containing protein n=1 Tax=Bosea minatitlanensis TaxID=128782 RepID=A0ABW0F8C1_9HYPH|nr:TonB-dependent receptor [Bosea minatitlanensis]MCT4494912.1 TonB-dependent receptor [Bosea minatitlanensis]